jgi:2-C-methyl-D-erythritol 4-phosphate cytidylyltransferase
MSKQEGVICAAIVPAAGTGTRMGTPSKKQFLALGGKPILALTLQALEACVEIDSILLVVPEEELEYCENRIVRDSGFTKVDSVLPGGKERQDSVYKGLQAVRPDADVIVIHDGVRPFLTGAMVRQTVASATNGISAITGVPVLDTTKSVNETGQVVKTLIRDTLWSIQTPQAFPYRTLADAYEAAYREGYYGTDDASLVERLGHPVRVVMGSRDNLKITSPEDMILGEAILKHRIGERA